jgi:hypothetical protein
MHPPRKKKAEPGANLAQRKLNTQHSNTSQRVHQQEAIRKPLTLNTLANALDQSQWDRLRWDIETGGGK